jgi:hypothetical protein
LDEGELTEGHELDRKWKVATTIAQHPTKKTDWEKNHARDRSCFAQYLNNGFAAHRR